MDTDIYKTCTPPSLLRLTPVLPSIGFQIQALAMYGFLVMMW